MKKIILILFSICFSVMAYAQSPGKMSYQAVIRNSSNELVTNTNIGVRIQILQGSENGTVVYTETHAAATNINGLTTLSIGSGTPISGSFSGINWSAGPYFLKTETDPTGGSNYTISGVSQLMSVPYALYAAQSGTTLTAGQGISITGNTIVNTGDTDPSDDIVNVTNAGGDLSGNFSNLQINSGAVGSSEIANGAITMTDIAPGVIPDPGWSLSGNTATSASDFLGTTDNQSLRFKVNNTAAGILDATTSEITALGIGALQNNTSGILNTAFGKNAMKYTITGNSNTAFGWSAFRDNTTGSGNTAIGRSALISNIIGDYNTASGYFSLFANTSGQNNTALGADALRSNTTGSYNIAIGRGSMFDNTTGSSNTSVGADAFDSNISGSFNTALGSKALAYNKANNRSTAIGYEAMYFAHNGTSATETYNTAVGSYALRGSDNPSNNSGRWNTAVGDEALTFITSGDYNTANGASSLHFNTTGGQNVAIGFGALYNNTTGSENTAIGQNALNTNTTNSRSTAIGHEAMLYAQNGANSIATYNTALGYNALKGSSTAANNTGRYNTAIGDAAMAANSSGSYNNALGVGALASNTTGQYNTAIGFEALVNNTSGSDNNAIGWHALLTNTSGSNNTALGDGAGTNGNHTQSTFIGADINISTDRTNVSALGYGIVNGQCTGNNQVLLGNTSIAQIRAQVTGITSYSDGRFKTNINDNVPGLDFISRLKPVTYNENPELLHRIWGTPDSVLQKMDFTGIREKRFIGFIAQDVEKAAKDCGFEFPGIEMPHRGNEVYTLQYVDFIMPLVKAVQEQQEMIDSLRQQNVALLQMAEDIENLKLELQTMKARLANNGQ